MYDKMIKKKSNTMNNSIYEALGKEMLSALPVLHVGDKNGSTGYIDYITCNDMTHSIMKGVDKFKRPFIAFRVQCTPIDDDEKQYNQVGTFFQRYSDNVEDWAYGTNYHMLNMIFFDSRVRPQHYENLKQRLRILIDKGTVQSFVSDEVDHVNGSGKYILKLI